MTDRPIPPTSRLIRLLNQASYDVHHLESTGTYRAAVAMLADHDPRLIQWQRIAIEERAEVRGRPLVTGSSGSGHSDPTANAVVGPAGAHLDHQHRELVSQCAIVRDTTGWLVAAVTRAIHDCAIVDYTPPDLAQTLDKLAWLMTVPHTVDNAAHALRLLDRTEDARELGAACETLRDEALVLRAQVSTVLADATRGTERPAQPKRPACIVCGSQDDVRSGRCETDRKFRRNHGIDRTKRIIDWQAMMGERTQPPPGLMAEARAQAKQKKGRAS